MFGTPLVAKQKLLEEGGARKERVTGGLSFRPWPKNGLDRRGCLVRQPDVPVVSDNYSFIGVLPADQADAC
ncbi:hypothetical protein RRG08_013612 [Elysia crispata]|uniref:Uncharacterized protein n=1 Tax=Elysia crispata TaxID=231223 RepID=A0AAE1APK8_9GAST|nr:hypothetical protein RRG08_013612 [Elysia crispata]